MAHLDLTQAKAALELRRAELVGDLERIGDEIQSIGVEQENERGSMGNHLADDGSSVMEAERLATMRADLNEVLTQVDSALDRIGTDSYGICQRCQQEINPERLEAFPYVAYCINCQTVIEREHALHAGR
jgi:RNA polymerase-binding transcription factor DksA